MEYLGRRWSEDSFFKEMMIENNSIFCDYGNALIDKK